jgi:hypothetical protein
VATRRTTGSVAFAPDPAAADRGDLTGDGFANFRDINPFVAILSGGG